MSFPRIRFVVFNTTVNAARSPDMDGHTIGVFGSDKEAKTAFENADSEEERS